ncbi:MAG: hypothetical protein KY451_12030 [Actinobacteria bacterium]|nr:hypothetical protein [Actinomycetota bacterium]
MTIAPTRLCANDDTPGVTIDTRSRLLTPAHKVTGCGEFTRRSDVLHAYAVSGRQMLQAVGAWHQLWVVHSRSDGTVWLTADEVAAALGISRPLWVELAALLEAGGLLEQHGRCYAVPDAGALEGVGRHYRPGGWRSLHRDTYRAGLLEQLGRDIDGGQRLAVQGVLAWVLLRHSAVRGAGVSRGAKRELAALVDPRTLRRYLQLLAGVLDCPSRGRLAYVGRQALERPQTGDTPSPTPSHQDDPSSAGPGRRRRLDDQECTFSTRPASPEETRNARSRACSRSGTSIGQDLPADPAARRPPVLPAWGSRDGNEHQALPDLVDHLERRVTGAWQIQARPDVRRLLSAALWSVDGDVPALVDALCADPFTGARSIPGVLRARAAVAVEGIRRQRAAVDAQVRGERWEQYERDRRAAEQAARAASMAAVEQERLDGELITAAAGELWPALLEHVAVDLRYRGVVAAEATARARVREVAERLTVPASTSLPCGSQADVRAAARERQHVLRAAVVQVLADGRKTRQPSRVDARRATAARARRGG